MEKFLNNRLWVGDFTRFEALAGGAFNHLNCQHTREFNQNFSKKSNAQGSPRRGGHGRFLMFHYIQFHYIERLGNSAPA